MHSSLRVASVVVAASAGLLLARPALAQDPPKPQGAAAPAQSAQPQPTQVAQPAQPVASSTDPIVSRTVGDHTCAVTERGGFDELDVRTAADVVCRELGKQHAAGGRYTLQFGRLGARVMFVLTSPAGEEKQAWLNGIDEIVTASPRVVEAIVQHKSVEQTEKVSTVLTQETQAPKVKQGNISFALGILGSTSIGTTPGVSTGLDMSLHYRPTGWGVFAEGRAGGIGNGDNKLGHASLGVGGQYMFTDDDFSPLAGAGIELAYYQVNRLSGSNYYGSYNGSGLGSFVEVGLAGMRTSRIGLYTTLRASVPFFALKNDGYSSSGSDSKYVVPLSLNVAMTFQ